MEPKSKQPHVNYGLGADLKRALTVARKTLDDMTERALASLGLSIGESDLLTVLLLAGAHAPAPTELADWLSLTTAGVTGRLNSLERRQLIERRPHVADGRRLTVHLTASGLTMAEQVLAIKEQTWSDVVERELGAERTSRLIRELDALIEAISRALG